MRLFPYTRTVEKYKVDSEGKRIPKVDEEGKEVKDQFETEFVSYRDGFDLDLIIRYVGQDDGVTILLHDGHEAAKVTPKLKNPSKPIVESNIIEVRTREWMQSEIQLRGEDAENFYEFVEAQKEYLVPVQPL